MKVSRVIVADETGMVSLSLWDDKAELVTQLREGESIELRGVSVRERLGEINLSLGRSGELQKSTKPVPANPITKLNALQNVKGLLTVEGVATDEPLVRQVVTDKGETVNLASFTLRDDAGSAKVTFWRDQVAAVTGMHAGTRLRILGVRVRAGLGGELELSSIPVTKIKKVDRPPSERPAWQDIRHVIALEAGLTTWVKGVILDSIGDQKLAAVCETCKSTLKVQNGSFTCDDCKATKTGNLVFDGQFKIDDGTGVAEVHISNLDAAQFPSIDLAQLRERMLREGSSDFKLTKEEFSGIIGKEVEIFGTAEPTGEQGKFKVKAQKAFVLGKL